MDKSKRCFIVSVGTSLIGNYYKDNKNDSTEPLMFKEGELEITSSNLNKEIPPNKVGFNNAIKNYGTTYEKIAAWLGKISKTNKIKIASAELNSLFSIDPPLNSPDKIVFFPTLTVYSCLCAQTLAADIKKRFNNKIDVKLIFTEGLGLTDGRDFADKGLLNFISNISRVIEENKDREIVLIPTGGYKSLIPYVTLAGLLYGQDRKIKINYIYETSDKLLELPSLPVGIDISILKPYYPKIRNIAGLQKDKDSVQNDFERLPGSIKNLFDTSTSQYKLNQLGNFIINRYREILYKPSLELLSSKISILDYLKREDSKKSDLREYFYQLVSIGSYFWIGDKVPEMVNHALNHHNNLFEITELILSPILSDDRNKKFLAPEELFILLCTIYFHDWGHSLSHFSGKRTLFATEIRDYHHILGYKRLKEKEVIKRLYETGLKWGKSGELWDNYLEAIATIGLYHRKAMPLKKGKGSFPCYVINEEYGPLACKEIRFEGEEIKEERKLFVAALFRVIDSIDTQYTRAPLQHELVFKIAAMNSEIKEKEEMAKKLSNLLDESLRQIIDNSIIKKVEKGEKIDIDGILEKLNNSEKSLVFLYLDAVLGAIMEKRQIKHHLKHIFMGVPRITLKLNNNNKHIITLEYRKSGEFSSYKEELLRAFPDDEEMKKEIKNFDETEDKLKKIVTDIKKDYDKVKDILKENNTEFIFTIREGNRVQIIGNEVDAI